MITYRKLGRNLIAIVFLATGGCSLFGSSSEEPPPIGISYDMVDSHGTVVGKVNFSPLGQGQVVDTKGTVIGNIVKPGQ